MDDVPRHAEAPAYMTADDVAAMLKVDRSTVFRWAAKDATFPAFRYGGVVRINAQRLARWLRDREQGVRGGRG